MPFSARGGITFTSVSPDKQWYQLTKEDVLAEVSTWSLTSARSEASVTLNSAIFDVNDAYRGGVVHPDGNIYYGPCVTTRSRYVRFNPSGNTQVEVTTPTLSGSAKYTVGALGADGKIYMAPSDMDKFMVIDPVADTVTLQNWGISLSGSNKYLAAIQAGDNIYFAGAADHVFVLNTASNTAFKSNYGLTSYFNNATSVKTVAGARSIHDDKVYFGPYQAAVNQFLVIDPAANTASLQAFGSTWASQGIQGVGNGKDGNLYVSPHNNTTQYRRINVASANVTVLSGTGQKVYSATMGADGNVYSISAGGTSGTLVDVPAGSITNNPTGLGSWGERWDAVLHLNGKIYALPIRTADRTMRIVTVPGATPGNIALTSYVKGR
jgi:hypothetical protein